TARARIARRAKEMPRHDDGAEGRAKEESGSLTIRYRRAKRRRPGRLARPGLTVLRCRDHPDREDLAGDGYGRVNGLGCDPFPSRPGESLSLKRGASDFCDIMECRECLIWSHRL